MSTEPVSRTPDQAETAFVAGVFSNILSFTPFGVVASMIFDLSLRSLVASYQQRYDAGEPFPANLPEVSFEVVSELYEKAAPQAELPALALQVRDRWQRAQLRDYIDGLLTALVEAQQDAAGITSRAPAQDCAVKLSGVLLDGLAGLRRIVDPVPLYLTKPLSDASTLIYATPGELYTLASALDMIGTSVAQTPANGALFRQRAEQLRDIAGLVPAAPPVPEPMG